MRFITLPSEEFPKIRWNVYTVCALPIASYWKNNKRTNPAEKKKSATSEETAFVNPIFLL